MDKTETMRIDGIKCLFWGKPLAFCGDALRASHTTFLSVNCATGYFCRRLEIHRLVGFSETYMISKQLSLNNIIIRICLHGGSVLLANRATLGGLISHTFIWKPHWGVYMLDRVAHLPGAPCLLARGTQLGGIAFYHVNVLCRPNPDCQGGINCWNMAAQGEFFQYYLLHRMTVNLKMSM